MKKIAELIDDGSVIHVAPNESVRKAVSTMTEHNIGAVAVVETGHLVGIFTERDLMRRVVAKNLDPASTSVADVMTTDVQTASPAETTRECVERMKSLHCRHLPVVDGDRLIGMVSFRDLLEIDHRQATEQAHFLADLVKNKPDYES